MAFEFYRSYIDHMAQSPKQDWREGHQEAINDFWENTSTVETVLGQVSVDSTLYENEDIQLTSVINPKTGESFGDEYRKIIYREYDQYETNKWLGKMYDFENSKWLITNTNTKIGANTSSILRKCNNILKWIDDSDTLNEIECVFDRNIASTNFDYGSEGVPQVSGDCKILVQLNNTTKNIEFNQRFLFDGHAFQVKQIDNHYSDTIMTIYIFEVQLQSNDDIENNIADGKNIVAPSSSETKVLPSNNKVLLNNSINYNIYKYIDGVSNTDTFTITASGVPLESYNLTIVDGNNFIVENLNQEFSPLVITCTNDVTSEITIKNITLGGEW